MDSREQRSQEERSWQEMKGRSRISKCRSHVAETEEREIGGVAGQSVETIINPSDLQGCSQCSPWLSRGDLDFEEEIAHSSPEIHRVAFLLGH